MKQLEPGTLSETTKSSVALLNVGTVDEMEVQESFIWTSLAFATSVVLIEIRPSFGPKLNIDFEMIPTEPFSSRVQEIGHPGIH